MIIMCFYAWKFQLISKRSSCLLLYENNLFAGSFRHCKEICFSFYEILHPQKKTYYHSIVAVNKNFFTDAHNIIKKQLNFK